MTAIDFVLYIMFWPFFFMAAVFPYAAVALVPIAQLVLVMLFVVPIVKFLLRVMYRVADWQIRK